MRNLFSLLRSTELGFAIFAASTYLISGAFAVNFKPVASPNLDLSQLGRVAIAGDFDSISLYQYQGQSQNGASSNGSQSLLSRFPNGAFASLQSSDAYIQAMCPFLLKNGTLEGVVVGGNFTSLGGVEAQGIALFTPETGEITPLPGLSGRVQALYCDQNASMVYVGGSFTGGNSSNAIAWTTGWTNLPFAGFNGPVTSITKSPSGNIIFGGSFDGLGNTTSPKSPNGQVIPITSANITAGPSSVQPGFSNASNILCGTDQGGPGKTWLLADNSPGALTATFQFGFVPNKLRVYNTNQDGRGTKTFRFTAIPLNGIMNLTFSDPITGEQRFCDAACPLPQNNITAQDFQFVNNVGMDGFRLDLSAWYGAGAGLNGIQLFEDDIYSFAINDFNEPSCANLGTAAKASSTGPWAITPSRASTSDFLTASLTGNPVDPNSASVVFQPDVQQSGNYSVTVFTPGCNQDNTCNTRGRVNITAQFTRGNGSSSKPVTTEIFQTNAFDKYDQVYFGYVDAASSSFRPSITLAPAAGQNGPLTVVAQRVRFELMSSTGGLKGLFEYDPNQATTNTDFSSSTIDKAGMSLDSGATVNALTVQGSTLFVAGNFTGSGKNNIFSIGTEVNSLPEDGLNGVVNAMYQNGSTIYVGGEFTATTKNDTHGLNGVAAFNTSTNRWAPLGAGVDGAVSYIVPFQLNLTGGNRPELALAVSGSFSHINAFGSNSSLAVQNIAVWIPGRDNWLQNLGLSSISLQGILTTETDVPGYSPLFGGNVASQASSASGAVELTSETLGLQQLPINVQNSAGSSSSPSKRKRSIATASNATGVVTGLLYHENGLNFTVVGGHFTAKASNGSTINNLLLINGTNSDSVTGLASGVSENSTVSALGGSGSLLFAGGQISGTVNGNDVNGLIVYDLIAANYAGTQPPALTGSNVVVNAIAPQPSSSSVFVGGNFDGAGSFNCPSLCNFDTKRQQWNSPGNGFSGQVTSLTWIGSSKMIIGGNLTIGGNTTSVATYDPSAQSFKTITNQDGPSGTISAVTPGSSDGKEIWVGGQNADGTAYLMKYNGSAWTTAPSKLFDAGTTIRGLQIFTLTTNHGSSDLIAANNDLLILGQLNIPSFGNASAALYNGSAVTPFLLANTASGRPGSLAQAFVENPQNFFKSGEHHLAVGFVVLIALGISLAIMFLLVLAGILVERWRRRRDGYMPAPQMAQREANMQRIPPEELFGSVGPNSNGRGPLHVL